MAFNINQRLNGLDPLAYSGVNPVQPPDFVTKPRPPTANDSKNILLGTIWLDTTGYPNTLPTNEDIYMLVALVGNQATWVNFGGGDLETLTSNAGGVVSPDANDNINLLGDGTTINGVGTPVNNTITFSTTGIVTTSFITDSGTAIPTAGAITFNAMSQAGSSVSFSGATSIVRLNTTDALGNTNIGSGSGNATLTSTNCTLLGKNTGHALTSSPNNTIVGALSGALLAGGSGANTIVGELSAANLLTGSGNIILGKSTGSALVGSESNNVIVGHAGIPAVNSSVVMAIPNGQTFFIWDGSDEFYVGVGSGNVGTNAVNNCVFGANSLPNVTTASQNVLLGNQIMTTATTTGSSNLVVGSTAFHVGTGSNNCLVGDSSLVTATTAATNTTLGNGTGYDSGAGLGLITGSGNILIGYTAGSAYRGAESNNILIGSSGLVGESNKTKIAGIRGITTTNADAVAVLIDSAGQLGTVSSSARYKDNIEPMASYSHVLMHLRPVVFNYKNHSPEAKSVGLIAEEVAAVAPQLAVYDADGLPETVKYHDLVPMLLNELQKMHKVLANSNLLIDELVNRVQLLESK